MNNKLCTVTISEEQFADLLEYFPFRTHRNGDSTTDFILTSPYVRNSWIAEYIGTIPDFNDKELRDRIHKSFAKVLLKEFGIYVETKTHREGTTR